MLKIKNKIKFLNNKTQKIYKTVLILVKIYRIKMKIFKMKIKELNKF